MKNQRIVAHKAVLIGIETSDKGLILSFLEWQSKALIFPILGGITACDKYVAAFSDRHWPQIEAWFQERGVKL